MINHFIENYFEKLINIFKDKSHIKYKDYKRETSQMLCILFYLFKLFDIF